jgi:hypothetical protein
VQSNDNDREIVVVVHWESSRRQAGNRPGTPTREAPGTPHTPAILPSNVATPACSIEIEAPWTVHGLSAGRISSRPRGAPDRARPLCSDSCVASRVRLSQTLICAGHVRLSPASIGGRKRSRRHSTAVFLAGHPGVDGGPNAGGTLGSAWTTLAASPGEREQNWQ